MVRRLLTSLVLAMLIVLLAAPSGSARPEHPAGAQGVQLTAPVGDAAGATTSTTQRAPATTLEAEERKDGSRPAPWLIGSAVAAGAVVLIGGSLLKRHVR